MAFLLASATNEIFITGKTNQIGSIGVIARRLDVTKENEEFGIKIEEFVSGKFKNVTSPDKKITDFDREAIQDQVDFLFSLFAKDVADRRDISVQEIVDMQAKIFIGQQAIDAKLVDSVSTIEQLLNSNEETFIMDTNELKANHPEVYAEIVGSATKDMETKDMETKGADEKMTEQKRILGIQSAAFPGMEELTAKLITDGVDEGTAALMFNQLRKEKDKKEKTTILASLASEAPESVATTEPDVSTKIKESKTPKETYEASAGLQEDYGSFEIYEAYLRAVEKGQVNIMGQDA